MSTIPAWKAFEAGMVFRPGDRVVSSLQNHEGYAGTVEQGHYQGQRDQCIVRWDNGVQDIVWTGWLSPT